MDIGKQKRFAYVHDWIVHRGGAEQVLADLIAKNLIGETEQTNTANKEQNVVRTIFVLFSPDVVRKQGETIIPIVSALPARVTRIFSLCQTRQIPLLKTIFDYRNLMFFFPVLCWLLRKKIQQWQPDEVIISSFAAAKNIVPGQWQFPTSLYLHSPMQYIRENYEDNVKKLTFPIKQFYQCATYYLRPRDKKPRQYTRIFANSAYTAAVAKRIYGYTAHIVYPAVQKQFFDEYLQEEKGKRYVFVGRIQRYVRDIDTVIQLCNHTKTWLVIIGDGPDMAYAKSIAGPTIIFVGHISSIQEKIALIKQAAGLINLAKESFGLATAEALCLGVPVFGRDAGATHDLVDETNGILVQEKKNDILIDAFTRFTHASFDRRAIAMRARHVFHHTLIFPTHEKTTHTHEKAM